MGAIVSRFRKSKTTIEILEEIDKHISHLEKFRKANQELRQKVIGKLILYSVVLYIGGAIALYFFFMPQEWTYKKLYGMLPFLFFPVLVYLLKRTLHWFFVRKISQNEGELQVLQDQRKDILENVMETETYKKAKEILEKYDPETKKKIEEEKNRKEMEKIKPISPNQPPGLRRRQVPGQPNPVHPGSPGVSMVQGPGMSPGIHQTPVNGMARGTISRPTSPVLPRPILPLSKTPLDKLMEYMIGDGTAHRYALICQNCCNHNGMALKEEFEFLAFRCAYCRFFNPARKQRPNAPRLPMPTPRSTNIKQEESKDVEDDETSNASSPESQSENIGMQEDDKSDEEFANDDGAAQDGNISVRGETSTAEEEMETEENGEPPQEIESSNVPVATAE